MSIGTKVGLTHEEIQTRLRDAGIQPTAQRIAICQYVLCEADHPTAEDVKNWTDINFPMLSLATVYNTLSTLVDAGLLREYRFPHTDKVIYDTNLENHYHFLDEESGRVHDIAHHQVVLNFQLGPEMQNKLITGVELVLRGSQKPPKQQKS